MKRTLLLAASLLASGAAILAQAPAPASAPPEGPHRVIQKVLVRVNGEVFTQTQLERLEIQALQSKKIQVASVRDLRNDAQLLSLLADVTPDILVDSVDELLMVQHGRELGFHMSDEQFKSFVEVFKKENKLSDADLKTALADEGLSMDAWRDMAEHTSIQRDVQQEELVPRARVTEEELHQYYAAHPDEFKTPATVTFREILVVIPTQMQNNKPVVSAAAAEDGLKKITDIRDRLTKGEDFVKVAAEVSESTTKDAGGLLGTFNLDDIDPVLRQKVEALKIGGVTEPLRSARGYQLLKVDATTKPELKPFEKVRDDLRTKVVQSRIDVEQQRFLVKIRADAVIDWKDDTLKKMYEKRLAERMAAK